MILFASDSQDDLRVVSRAASKLPRKFPWVKCVYVPPPDGDNRASPLRDVDLENCKLVIVRLRAGSSTGRNVIQELEARCAREQIAILNCTSDQAPEVAGESGIVKIGGRTSKAIEYADRGGVENLFNLLRFAGREMLGLAIDYEPPRDMATSGIYRPSVMDAAASKGTRPMVGIVFYRSHWLSGNTGFVDQIVQALDGGGCDALAVFCKGLTPSVASEGPEENVLSWYFLDERGRSKIDCLISTLSFSWSGLADRRAASASMRTGSVLADLNVPVLQTASLFGTEEEWRKESRGLSPLELTLSVALPEIDGRIASVPLVFRSRPDGDVDRMVASPGRAAMLARMARRWAVLRRRPNVEKRVAVILHNYPSSDGRIGNGVGLDTLMSTVRLLHALAGDGYDVGDEGEVPADGDALVRLLLAGRTYDESYGSRNGHLGIDIDAYEKWFLALPESPMKRVVDRWGDPVRSEDLKLNDRIAGLRFGNVFVGIQPPRGFGYDVEEIMHHPDLPPSHEYLAFYSWLRNEFAADAVVHMGKHGSLEWLPGKGSGLSEECFPEVALGDVPNLYPFIVNDPGEGSQAKRRAHAVVVDHLTPAMTQADSYGELERLEDLIDQYRKVELTSPNRARQVANQIVEFVEETEVDADIAGPAMGEQVETFINRLEAYLYDLSSAQIRSGLHVLGSPPEGKALVDLLIALAKPRHEARPGLPDAVIRSFGLDPANLRGDPAGAIAKVDLGTQAEMDREIHTNASLLKHVDELSVRMVEAMADRDFDPYAAREVVTKVLGSGSLQVERSLEYIGRVICPAVRKASDEIENLLGALRGGFVPPGPSGAPTRGALEVLPTGRNFFSVDPRAMPSRSAWETGVKLADALLAEHKAEEAAYPESIGIVLWGTSAMRTDGEDVAEVLYLVGVRPLWDEKGRQVLDLEVIPAAELGRPRIDVTVRISGFFRDAFANLAEMIDKAVGLVADLDEPDEVNFVAKHMRRELNELKVQGMREDAARQSASARVFGPKPEGYGSGVLPLLDSTRWESTDDIAAVYLARSGFAYGRGRTGLPASAEFERRMLATTVAVKNQDNREHDIFDSDDYFQEHGGMIATIRAISGTAPSAYIGDSSDPGAPSVRTLDQEAKRVFRTRSANPKWIDSLIKHGYRGASELAATVDYMFGYDATAGVVDDWMYEQLVAQYLEDGAIREFLEQKNPWAMQQMIERLLEAADRGLWRAPRESTLATLRSLFLRLDARLEGEQELTESLGRRD